MKIKDLISSFALLPQFCFLTCAVFSCLAMVGRYIPGLVLSYSAGESQCREQVRQGNSSPLLLSRMYEALKADLNVAQRSRASMVR